jgi:hypothetical protein
VRDKWGGMYESGETPPPSSEWGVLIEECTGRERVWSVSLRKPVADRDEAVAIATRLARQHRPEHPALERDRVVYRIGEDIWLVNVEGAMSSYHFRISIARRSSA